MNSPPEFTGEPPDIDSRYVIRPQVFLCNASQITLLSFNNDERRDTLEDPYSVTYENLL